MKWIKATQQDFERIIQFYRDVISRTEDMAVFARWEYGKHPTDERIRDYIRSGAMYCSEKDGSILSAAAVTTQAEDYHGAAWSLPLEDDAVLVVHLLAVAPPMAGKRHRPGYHGPDHWTGPDNGKTGGAAGCPGLQHTGAAAL